MFLTVLKKRIEKTKNRVKFDLEATIKIIDFKYMDIFSATESADSKTEKNGIFYQKGWIRCSTCWVEKPGIPTNLCKTKTPAGNLVFFYHRENDLLNQEIRTIRVLDNFFFY